MGNDVHDACVLQRTSKGQASTFDELELSEHARRLLCLVNGYTPLSVLARRLGTAHDWRLVAHELLVRGLVCLRVDEPRESPFSTVSVHKPVD
jgi:hypothetical protein